MFRVSCCMLSETPLCNSQTLLSFPQGQHAKCFLPAVEGAAASAAQHTVWSHDKSAGKFRPKRYDRVGPSAVLYRCGTSGECDFCRGKSFILRPTDCVFM